MIAQLNVLCECDHSCPRCQGTGEGVYGGTCARCDGRGVLVKKSFESLEEFEVEWFKDDLSDLRIISGLDECEVCGASFMEFVKDELKRSLASET